MYKDSDRKPALSHLSRNVENLESQIKDVPRPAEPEKMEKNCFFREKFRINSGELRVARGGFGAEAPPLAARPEIPRLRR